MIQRFAALVVILAGLGLTGPARAAEAAASGVQFTKLADRVRVEINGQLFTEYVFKGAPHVYFHPLIGPGGARMTRDWPMKDTEGEEHDHPHHRSLWFSHGAVNGVDFWSESGRAGKIQHDRILEMTSGAESGVLRAAHKWVGPGGEVVLRDEVTFRVFNRPATERVFDFEIALQAGEKEVIFGDTKEGTMGIRVAETMRLSRGKGKPGQGRIVLSTGVRDDEMPARGGTQTWGKRAPWCDYHGPVQGKTVGIALFDHPSNPRYPTWWHVRDYGLFAANPFGEHDFEKKPAGSGNLALAPQKSMTFKYRIYLHEGDEKAAKVAERYGEFIGGAR